MPRRAPSLVLVVFVAAIAGCGSRQADERSPRLWVIQGGWASQLVYFEPAIARPMFFRPPGVILGAVPGSHRGIRAFAWASYADFRRFMRSPPWVDLETAMYDPEAWTATPIREQRNPARFFRAFSELARRHGLTVIITPHPSLMSVAGARCGAGPDEPEVDAYVRCDISGAAARYADIVETQAQGLEEDTDAYRSFVETTARQAREANPGVRVIAGLSTHWDATVGTMYEAWASVRDVVDGYYLSISGSDRVRAARRFLQRLPR